MASIKASLSDEEIAIRIETTIAPARSGVDFVAPQKKITPFKIIKIKGV